MIPFTRPMDMNAKHHPVIEWGTIPRGSSMCTTEYLDGVPCSKVYIYSHMAVGYIYGRTDHPIWIGYLKDE